MSNATNTETVVIDGETYERVDRQGYASTTRPGFSISIDGKRACFLKVVPPEFPQEPGPYLVTWEGLFGGRITHKDMWMIRTASALEDTTKYSLAESYNNRTYRLISVKKGGVIE